MTTPEKSAAEHGMSPVVLSTNTANSVIHLYRAEVTRMTASRVRLDTTTNWAVITTAALTGYAFGPQGHHSVVLFAMLATYFFLHVEARRFRSFEISQLRVRVLERMFYPAVLGDPTDAAWMGYVARDLQRPHVPIDRLAALGWRLRHNYLWIFSAQLIAWLAKLDLSRQAGDGLVTFVSLAGIEVVPGAVVFALVGLFYAVLGLLALRAHTYPLEMD